MKKIFTLSVLLVFILGASAQVMKQVNYRGAFAPAPTPMWTDGWANWDPQNTAYGVSDVTISGHITTNTTWTKNHVYLLNGVVYIDTLVTLTIEPGTIIMGNSSIANSSLIVKRGGKLSAEGTAANPIVFTSNQAAGSRTKGDWGGVILLGRAVTNHVGGVGYIEGLATSIDHAFGGTDNADNSGTLKYVRIEYGGYVFTTDKEINGLTFGAVGSGTTIDFVQASFTNDDSFEWFGGTVNCTHLVAYRGLDDDFDTDNGFSGKVQFALGVKDPTISDQSAGSTSEGFESDNDATGSTNSPQTSATFSNITIIGPYRGDVSAVIPSNKFRRGARLRRNTALKVFNSIFMDYATGLFIDGTAAATNAANGVLKYKNNIVALAGPTQKVAEDANSRTVFFNAANSNDSLSSTTGVLVTPYNFTAPDYRPATGSLALGNYDFSFSTGGTLPVSLVKFTGENIKNDNLLQWETKSENNNKGFEIERSINNGETFSSIGFVAMLSAGGNSATNLNYSFTDRNVLSGNLYYRLKQMDKDGRITISNTIVLSKKQSEKLILSVLYPNPVSDNNLKLMISSSNQQNITVVINDIFGRKMIERNIKLLSGNNNCQLNLQSITAGNYFVTIIPADGGASQVQKFIKQ